MRDVHDKYILTLLTYAMQDTVQKAAAASKAAAKATAPAKPTDNTTVAVDNNVPSAVTRVWPLGHIISRSRSGSTRYRRGSVQFVGMVNRRFSLGPQGPLRAPSQHGSPVRLSQSAKVQIEAGVNKEALGRLSEQLQALDRDSPSFPPSYPAKQRSRSLPPSNPAKQRADIRNDKMQDGDRRIGAVKATPEAQMSDASPFVSPSHSGPGCEKALAAHPSPEPASTSTSEQDHAVALPPCASSLQEAVTAAGSVSNEFSQESLPVEPVTVVNLPSCSDPPKDKAHQRTSLVRAGKCSKIEEGFSAPTLSCAWCPGGDTQVSAEVPGDAAPLTPEDKEQAALRCENRMLRNASLAHLKELEVLKATLERLGSSFGSRLSSGSVRLSMDDAEHSDN